VDSAASLVIPLRLVDSKASLVVPPRMTSSFEAVVCPRCQTKREKSRSPSLSSSVRTS